MRVAHFIQRYPPALGGSEAYFARLGRFLTAQGDQVSVFTTSAVGLEAFWSRRGQSVAAGDTVEDGVRVRRYGVWRWLGRRVVLKVLSLFPQRTWQGLMMPCNPIAPAMWRDAGHDGQPFDIVHAAAFPYAFPILCARRLARRLGVPFLLTPFLHLGDPDDPHDATRRAYTQPALRALLLSADRVFAQTTSERDTILRLGVPAEHIVLQGLGVDWLECTRGDRAAARARWQAGPEEFVVGHLANHSAEKGTMDLLRAAELLWLRGLPLRVVLAGPEMTSFQHFWRDFAAGHGPGAALPVVRLGTLTDAGKRDFFAGLDAFVLPSRSDSFGLVLLEAWANVLPNVGYRAGGIRDVIHHERD